MAIYTDRRPLGTPNADKNKQRYIERHKEAIKDYIKGLDTPITGKGMPIRIPKNVIPYPYEKKNTGIKHTIGHGNDKFLKGDRVKKPQSGQGEGGQQGSPDGKGEQLHEFVLSEKELLDLYFEGWELPDFIKESDEVSETKFVTGGYVSEGSPSKLAVKKTYEESLKRKIALEAAINKKIKDLEIFQMDLIDTFGLNCPKVQKLEEEIIKLQEKKKKLAFIEDKDVRYRNSIPQISHERKAVIVFILDVSGSMNDDFKFIAKKCFYNIYWFLHKCYDKKVEIRYVIHHSEAKEVDEDHFFNTEETGGTMCSTGIDLAREILNEKKYAKYNKYTAYATDTEDFVSDVIPSVEIIDDVLKISQYYIVLGIKVIRDNPFRHYMRALNENAKNFVYLDIKKDTIYQQLKRIFSKEGK